MRIAILTLPLNTNYGGILQAYALQKVLQSLGHDVIVLNQDRTTRQSQLMVLKSYLVFLVRRYILGRNIVYKSPHIINLERTERETYTQLFLEKHINTYQIRKLEKDVPKELDVIIVGSDQIWRYIYFTQAFKCSIENAFLKFCENENIRRIAYAASFGTDKWDYSEKETKECGRLLRKFDAVGVREVDAIKLCHNRLGRNNVQLVLDPTMLLTKEDYLKLLVNAEVSKCKGDLMYYILDETKDKIDLVEHIASERKLTPFRVGSKTEDIMASNTERIQPPLEEWLKGFMDAKFVVTDSFHACVFSIIFGKPFIVIGNQYRGLSRFSSLLGLFSLDKNMIMSLNEYDKSYTYEVPTSSKENLESLRLKSIKFLQENLNN